MKTENLLIGSILVIIGIIGLIDSVPRNKRERNSYSGKYLIASICLLAIGVYLVFKELVTLY